MQFTRERDRLHVVVAGEKIATYAFADEQVKRPYFRDLHTLDGLRVMRPHPPVKGRDLVDHATMHPGLWLAFGDLSGHDFWRNKARVELEKYTSDPISRPGGGSFAVRHRWLAADNSLVCREEARFTFLLQKQSWLLLWDSTFHAGKTPLVFGDQEEMGLGVRLATPLTVKYGGRILNSEGAENEKQAWGKPADWCDYSGTISGRHAGVALFSFPDNFRDPWFHVRDYGLMVANPFGRNAFTKKEKSRVVVKPDEPLRLRYGVLVHSGEEPTAAALAKAYEAFIVEAARMD